MAARRRGRRRAPLTLLSVLREATRRRVQPVASAARHGGAGEAAARAGRSPAPAPAGAGARPGAEDSRAGLLPPPLLLLLLLLRGAAASESPAAGDSREVPKHRAAGRGSAASSPTLAAPGGVTPALIRFI